MTEPLIRDIPSIRKSLEDIKTLRVARKILFLLRPILRLFKKDVSGVDDAFVDFDELQRMADDLTHIPDDFNNLFAQRGWIVYDLMSVEVAKAAIEKAATGDIDGAEADLVDYYNAETVRWKLRTMTAVKAFRPRMRLAEKAFEDFCSGRYHACIPVVLALLDGLVNELYRKGHKRQGFFAKDVSLEAWDSIAAHSKGLNVLVGLFGKGRYETSTETLAIPFRHGIMHGMDLGYDNRMVAAKTWAALFATRDWAIKAERDLLEPPPEEPQKSWGDIFRQVVDSVNDTKRLREWTPRVVQPGKDIPVTGGPNAFESGTPEQRLAEFLGYWQARNYGFMAKCLSVATGYSKSHLPALVREVYGSKHLRSFAFVEINDIAASVTEIRTRLVFGESGAEVERITGFRLICEDSGGDLTARWKSGGTWVVINWRTL